jgi:hypothetical protein
MKLELRGWRRETTTHQHEVTPVTLKGKQYVPASDATGPMSWNADYSTFGKVDGLSLSGSFLMKLDFEEKDLEAWLRKFVQADPERAIKLLSKMQAQAFINLAKELAKATEDDEL